MSYITDRLVAMSYPAQNMQSLIRNPMWQVRRVLDDRHGSHYKVYNLCVEACYDPANFYNRIETLPFDDNHVPPLSLVKTFCESVSEWLSQDPLNVAVIHCMAGKGRTGLMVCCYLVYKGMPADEALQLYADRRSTNNEGVTIASQRRYVSYWGMLVEPSIRSATELHIPPTVTRELRRIRLYDTVSIHQVNFKILELQMVPEQLYQPAVQIADGVCESMTKGFLRSVSPRYYLSFLSRDGDERKGEAENPRWVAQMETEKPLIHKKTCLDHYFEKPLLVSGDFRVVFYDGMGGKIFYACFNTGFIVNSMIQLSRGDMDKVGRKAKSICGALFCVELLFGPLESHYPVQPHLPTLEHGSEIYDESF